MPIDPTVQLALTEGFTIQRIQVHDNDTGESAPKWALVIKGEIVSLSRNFPQVIDDLKSALEG